MYVCVLECLHKLLQRNTMAYTQHVIRLMASSDDPTGFVTITSKRRVANVRFSSIFMLHTSRNWVKL